MNEIRIKENKGIANINGEAYFYKKNEGFIEFIVEKIADKFGIKCAHYENKRVGNGDYCFSRDLGLEGSFTTASGMGLSSHNLSDIEAFIAAYFPEDCERLNQELIKVYFMDLLIMNVNRENDNWGFLVGKDGVHICILDNDSSFVDERSVMTSMKDNPTRNSLFEIGNILDTFSKEDVELFKQMFSALSCETIREFVEVVEDEQKRKIQLKNDFYEKFEMGHFRIRRLFEERDKSIVYNNSWWSNENSNA